MTKSLPTKTLQQVAQHGSTGESFRNDDSKTSAITFVAFLALLAWRRFIPAIAKLETSLMQAQGAGHHGRELLRSVQPILGAEAAAGFRLPGHGRPTRLVA